VAAVVACGLLMAGCSGSSSPQPDGSEHVKLEVIDEVDFAAVLEGHRGKVVLVDFWATWCDDCVKLFPHTVELHKRFADRGLTVISVDFDDPDEERTVALEFLINKGATFQNFISRYGTGTQSAEAFDLDGPLPQMKLYDRQGRLHKSFGGELGEVDPRELDRAVEELLGKT
jgi:thiol-disulfide isomerase/thioredoxin